jgi:hypothetical protein
MTGITAIILITTAEIFKLFTVFALSTVKFFLMLFSAYAMGLTFWEALLATVAGGIFGAVSFYYLSGLIIALFSRITLFKRKNKKEKQPKPIFSRKNKIIVKIKRTYGLIGLAALTPVLLSIPVGVFIIRKYYGNNRFALPVTCLAIVVWSVAVLLGLYLW